VAQRLLERRGGRIIDIQIDEPDLSCVLCLEPRHDGRYPLAGRSPDACPQ